MPTAPYLCAALGRLSRFGHSYFEVARFQRSSALVQFNFLEEFVLIRAVRDDETELDCPPSIDKLERCSIRKLANKCDCCEMKFSKGELVATDEFLRTRWRALFFRRSWGLIAPCSALTRCATCGSSSALAHIWFIPVDAEPACFPAPQLINLDYVAQELIEGRAKEKKKPAAVIK